ncbi:MAG: branched-chain amino acid ABC transporter permease [bacterium]
MGGRNASILAILFLFIIVFPLSATNPYYISVMVFVGIHSLVAIGLSLLMGYAGQVSLGHAALFGLGAYTSGILTAKVGLSPWMALLASVLLTGGVAFLVGLPALKLRGHYLAMATLGFGEIVHIIMNGSVELTGGPSGLGEIPTLSIGSFHFDSDLKYYYLIWAFVFVVLIFSLNIIHSRVGRALRSIRASEIASHVMGVDVSRCKIQVFVLSAVYAAVAGWLYAHFVTFISPSSFDLMFSVVLVTMVVVGGMSNIWGALVGAALLTVLPEYLTAFKDFDMLIYGSILVLILIFMPGGLVGGIANLFDLLRRAVRVKA